MFVFSGATGELVRVFTTDLGSSVVDVAFFSDDTLAIATLVGTIAAYDVATGNIVLNFECGFALESFGVSCTYFAAAGMCAPAPSLHCRELTPAYIKKFQGGTTGRFLVATKAGVRKLVYTAPPGAHYGLITFSEDERKVYAKTMLYRIGTFDIEHSDQAPHFVDAPELTVIALSSTGLMAAFHADHQEDARVYSLRDPDADEFLMQVFVFHDTNGQMCFIGSQRLLIASGGSLVQHYLADVHV